MNWNDFKNVVTPLLSGFVARGFIKLLAATSLGAGFLTQDQTQQLSIWIVCGLLTLLELAISWYKTRQAKRLATQIAVIVKSVDAANLTPIQLSQIDAVQSQVPGVKALVDKLQG